MPFSFTSTPLPGLILIEPKIFYDGRGWFMESYKSSDFRKGGIEEIFIQDNHSRSIRNVLRGLHFQKAPHAQGKLVRCTQGEVWDVAVDLRRDSPTFSSYYGRKLSKENKLMLYIPSGFAHGFVTLSEYAEIQYKNTAKYDHALDGGVHFDGKYLGIYWPIPKTQVIVSNKDSTLPTLEELWEDFAL